jgi:hypothetical protein
VLVNLTTASIGEEKAKVKKKNVNISNIFSPGIIVENPSIR